MKKIMIANGQYKDKQGQMKTSWKEVGVIMTSAKGGEFCLLDPTVNLAGFPREQGKDRLIASIFEDDREQQRPSQDTSRYAEQPKVPGTDVPLELENTEIPF